MKGKLKKINFLLLKIIIYKFREKKNKREIYYLARDAFFNKLAMQ